MVGWSVGRLVGWLSDLSLTEPSDSSRPKELKENERGRVPKPVSSFIPESFPKPLQLFRRLTPDGGIKTSMFKWRFCNKAELHFTPEQRNSQLGAGRSLVSAIVSPSRKRTRSAVPLPVEALFCLLGYDAPVAIFKGTGA